MIQRGKDLLVRMFNSIGAKSDRHAVEVCAQLLGLPSRYCPEEFCNIVLGPFLRFLDPPAKPAQAKSATPDAGAAVAPARSPRKPRKRVLLRTRRKGGRNSVILPDEDDVPAEESTVAAVESKASDNHDHDEPTSPAESSDVEPAENEDGSSSELEESELQSAEDAEAADDIDDAVGGDELQMTQDADGQSWHCARIDYCFQAQSPRARVAVSLCARMATRADSEA